MSDYGWIPQLLAGLQGEREAGKLTDEQKKILLEVYQKASNPGAFPQLTAEELPQSEAGAVRTDPALRMAQMNAMSKMKEIEDSGGLTLADMAAQKKTTDMANRSAGAMHGKVLESMARRGVGGSGAELVANLQANQDSAERANEAGLQSQANAQKRYYDSIMGRAQMAGNVRGQDFSENSRTAEARDARNRYNNTQGFQARQHNVDIPMRLLGIQSQAGGALSGFYGNEAQSERQKWAGIGQAGREAMRNGGGSSSSSGGGYSSAPLVNADSYNGQQSGGPYSADGFPIYSDEDEWKGW